MWDRFLKACRCQPVDRTPVWFMRQAGRYMSEYRALRERYGILELIKTPELAAQVTLQPLAAMDVDAAIIFADILTLLEGMGLRLEFARGEGPVIHNPIRRAADVDALADPPIQESVGYTLAALGMVRRELDGRTPVIGFSGAPFTLASYAIEGGASRHYLHTKGLMFEAPDVWHRLMSVLAERVGRYLAAQAAAGAQALQLFDSWAGELAPADYRAHVLPYTRRAIELAVGSGQASEQATEQATGQTSGQTSGRASGHGSRQSTPTTSPPTVPVIHFATHTAGFLEDFAAAGADVVGVDWRMDLAAAGRRIGAGRAIQGNLDPIALFAPWEALRDRVDAVMVAAGGRAGHIFNVGHGILPGTPVASVARVADYVHQWSTRDIQAMS